MSTPTRDREIELLLDVVRRVSGLEFPEGRRSMLRRAVDTAMDRHGVTSIGALRRVLSDPSRSAELEAFVASLTIGETHFFRNRPQMRALTEIVLPRLIAERRGRRTLRIWSAGCSTGEEPYSIAMAIDRLLPDRRGWHVHVLATDINKDALARGRAGLYGEWSFRGVERDLRERYFTPRGGRYELDPEIRRMVRFDYLNLIDDRSTSIQPDTQAMDLILCRNVLIYFREDTIETVVRRLAASLSPDGWFLTGHAEAPLPVFRRLFVAQEFPMAVLFRAPEPGSAPAPPATPPVPEAARVPEPPVPTTDPALPAAVLEAERRARGGDRSGGLAALDALAESNPGAAEPLVASARLLAGLHRLDEAEHRARAAIVREPLSPHGHYILGLVLEARERPGPALEALRRAIYIDPDFALAHVAVASHLAAVGQTRRAVAALDRVRAIAGAMAADAPIEGGDGITAGRLAEIARVRRQLIEHEVSA